ncbi:putative CxxxxCH...CXXCH cytochrome family protein [Geothermobacter ehrlichii]|uniref:Putative CxxxxCH...CXXCH cytochrome family protein n=1 Tax=Geothermobacter ehrlichii TaxID=213224 RepID=A0A5D3WJY2_9BACT|nr:CxxxxCH/CxxCH domain-containing protein [Geothermobacter ehrlichii]TYO97132.1 putative CxxxxCH...CXXCH cytochrome family protein [Geothermobacter ehrlichii]
MRSGFLRTILVLALVLVAVPAMVQARAVHYFPCEDCHRAGADPLSVTTNICLDCHDTTSGSVTLNDSTVASATGRFSAGDASNAFGNNPAPGKQTSHNWGASDTNPAAGAKAPSNRFFYGRQGFSTGVVACSRCHDPHGDNVQNPKLLKLPPSRGYVAEDMCLDCHADWNVSNHGIETHPMGVRLDTAPGNLPDASNDPADKYYDTPDNSQTANGNVTLVNGEVTCTSCHGVHWVDSDGSTADTQGSVGQGDGKLLKHNGVSNETISSSICQSCHKYTGHAPAASQQLGCLVCHSGHDYDPNGNPNIYMLRKQITLDTTNIKASGSTNDTVTLDYTTYPPAANYDNGGGNGSLCLSCHDFPTGHQPDAQCADCHAHDNQNGSFAAGCGSCHGYAPSLDQPGNTTPGGYAVSTQNPAHDYSASAAYKDESLTPHATHANGSGNYSYACAVCHGDGAGQLGSADHDAGTFQQVLDGAIGTLPAVTTGSGATSPSYNTAAPGTCSAVYCHSNGNPRGGTLQTVSVSWANGKGTIFTPANTTDNECQQCHGNDAASMSGVNSALHQQHLGAGTMLGRTFDCSVCHSTVAASNTELLASAIGGDHVNGSKEVSFNSSFNLGAGTLGGGSYGTDGTCSVYCHSNGSVNATPDWDDPTTGQCGTCHQVNASGDTGAPLSGAHAKHVFDANGPQLACSDCHGAGADTGSHANHVNGAIDAPAQSACNTCHGAASGQTTGPDREPVWTDTTSVDCETCHTGSAIAVVKGNTAPAQNSFATLGHGKSSITGPACTGCHDTSGGKHFDGTTGDPQLTGGAVADDAFCQTCHATKAVHYANNGTSGSTSGNSCAYCHEPHGNGVGAGFDAMVLSSVGPAGNKAPAAVTGFTDKTAASSYFDASSFSGVCQVCHDPAGGVGGINHYNRTTADGHNSTTACITCHNHDDATVAFKASANSCEGCHAGTIASNGHPAHVNKNGGAIDADLSDCAACHGSQVNGADPYTLTGGGGGLHQNGTVDFAAGIADGGSGQAVTCSAACHSTASGKATVWNSGTISCDACHGQPPADGGGDGLAHSKHVALTGVDCTTCHGAMPTDTSHVSYAAGTDLQILQDMAQAVADEATVVDATWDDANNTCNNAACHNPSGGTYAADWDTSNSTNNCDLCHSSTDPGTGSHTSHVNNAALIGDNLACAECHVDNGTNTAHRDGTVDVLSALTYSGEVAIPSTGVGNCSTSQCHSNDDDTAAPFFSYVPSPNWGDNSATDKCTVCHLKPPVTGDHQAHWVSLRLSRGLSCQSCHNGTAKSDFTIVSGGNHLNGATDGTGFYDVAGGGTYNGSAVTITYTKGAPSTCTASCHQVNPKTWTNAASCEACHGDLSYVGPTHTAHIDISGSIQLDVSECVICHGADVSTYTATGGDGGSGTHQDGTVQLQPGITAAATGCASACHDSSASDGYWGDADGLNCTACHNNGTNDNNIANAAPTTGSHVAHVTTEGMQCADCHGTLPTDTSHISGLDAAGQAGADQGETLTNKATPVADNATVDDSPFNDAGNSFVDSANTCSNTYCHDPSNTGQVATWGVDTVSCALCHGDDAGADQMATGTHPNHLNATATFGLTITCDKCHPDNTGNYGHFIKSTGPTTVNQAVQFGGTVITGAQQSPVVDGKYSGEVALPNTGYGTCGTTACHNNGQGGAPNNSTYTWGTTNIQSCLLCHNNMPTTGVHATHLDGNVKYGPYASVGGSTNCGRCHAANANNTSMAGQATHINGQISFADGNEVASGGIGGDTTVTVCDTCHGGSTAVSLAGTGAKATWSAGGPVACETCHGDYNQANVDGALAPIRAGSAYDNSGHGKTGVGKACVDCHDHAGDHIGYTTNRLNTIGGKDYNTDPNGFCNACHTGVPNSAVHYANTQTTGGTSDDGVTCVTCHDQHGQNGGQDAMIASTIQTHTVSGFTDRTARSSYANASNQGVCQVCHDPSEVLHFNRTTEELASHNSGQICTTCHSHTSNPIFKPSGCNGCHGGGTVGASASNYWPDGSDGAAGPNDAGRHLKHMNVLSQRVYGVSAVALLDDPAADSKQKALCEYCHAAVTNDSDHGATANLPAEVFVDKDLNRHAQTLWGTADTDAAYSGGSCSSVDCHNGKTTGTGTFGWYDAGTSTCTMCHTPGDPGANPTTGLHVVSAAGVQAHDDTLGTAGCTECHNALPAIDNTSASTHINGTFVVDSGVNDDRGITVSGNITAFSQAAVGTSDSCAASCHSDGGNWQRLWSTSADSTATSLGSARCDVCHGQLNNWRAGMSVNHNLAKINDGTHTDCTQCHVAPDAPYDFATMHENGTIEVNDNTAMSYDPANGTCSVSVCHGSTTPTRGPGASTIFAENLLNGPGASCNSCHLATGGSANNNTVLGYTFNNRTGAHAKHVSSAATAYGSTAISTQSTAYNYGCGVCHPTDEGTYHQNGTLDVLLDPTTAPGTIKALNDPAAGYSAGSCSGVYCHSDGVNVAAGSSPDFLTGTFTNPNGDYCQNCHGNQPTTGSHGKHVVGIHYDDIYSGTTGLISDAGATGAGHGDVTTAITITCALCHNATVNQWYNGSNTACVSCHGSTGSAVDKTVITNADLDKTLHVNGVKDVSFAPVDPVRSKAQVRDFTTSEPELDNNWQRVGGYKVDANSHDESKVSPPLNTATMWDGGTKNCTVACHNGNTITWGTTGISCNACHTQLPK